MSTSGSDPLAPLKTLIEWAVITQAPRLQTAVNFTVEDCFSKGSQPTRARLTEVCWQVRAQSTDLASMSRLREQVSQRITAVPLLLQKVWQQVDGVTGIWCHR